MLFKYLSLLSYADGGLWTCSVGPLMPLKSVFSTSPSPSHWYTFTCAPIIMLHTYFCIHEPSSTQLLHLRDIWITGINTLSYWKVNTCFKQVTVKIHSDPWIYNQCIKLTLKFSVYIWVMIHQKKHFRRVYFMCVSGGSMT